MPGLGQLSAGGDGCAAGRANEGDPGGSESRSRQAVELGVEVNDERPEVLHRPTLLPNVLLAERKSHAADDQRSDG